MGRRARRPLDFRLAASGTARESISLVLSHPVGGSLSRLPLGINAALSNPSGRAALPPLPVGPSLMENNTDLFPFDLEPRP